MKRKDIYARAGVLDLSGGGNSAKEAKRMIDRFFRKFGVKAVTLGTGCEGYRGMMMID